MNRIEALRILGLDESATADDIRVAYKEVAQILHPDRFASSKKLQERATEQFKNLQEAYDYLTSGKGKNKASTSTNSTHARSASSDFTTAREYEARLAGISAARTQLVKQRDAILDHRRNGLIMLGFGAVVCLLFRKIPLALAVGSTGVVWGIVQTLSSVATLNKLNEHINRLNEEQKAIAKNLEDLES